MTQLQTLFEADRLRREAMIRADTEALAMMFADELQWTHASGKQDDKKSLLDKIAAGDVSYHQLEVSNDDMMSFGETLIHRGNLSGQVSVNKREMELRSRFLSVWRRSGNGLQLLAWQSTNF